MKLKLAIKLHLETLNNLFLENVILFMTAKKYKGIGSNEKKGSKRYLYITTRITMSLKHFLN